MPVFKYCFKITVSKKSGSPAGLPLYQIGFSGIYPFHDLKAVIGFLDLEETGTLVGIDVGAVENEIKLTVKAIENHTVATILIVNKLVGMTPRAVDAAAVADGQRLYIPVLGPRVEA